MSISKTYTALTELEAVNLMLATIGSSPVSSLSSGNDLHVSMAQQFLHNQSREVQSKGYHFNTEYEYPLPRNISNEIPSLPNAIRLEVTDDFYDDVDVVVRGSRLYDLKNHTYTFTQNLKVDVVMFLPWEDTPQPFRQFVAIAAARKFQRRVQGDEYIDKYTESEERMAMNNFEDYDSDTGDYSLKDSDEIQLMLAR